MGNKVYFFSFGCKVNRSEIDDMQAELGGYDAIVTDNPLEADIAIINTCAVTEKAQKESLRYLIALKKKNNNLKIHATGCLAQLLKEDLKKYGIDAIIENSNKNKLISNLNFKKQQKINNSRGFGTRAFLKIQEGCNKYCSYCIIPSLRGKPKSVSIENVLSILQKKINEGKKEIVLTGIHLGLFGYEKTNENLTELLTKIVKQDGDFRVRLSSLYVDGIDDKLLEVIANSNSKIVPHFHISLQSASDSILKSMGREYTINDFLEKIVKIRSVMPDAFIGIDLIVGFPGEDEKLFLETKNFFINLPQLLYIDSMHIFPFSSRKGTKAEALPGKVDSKIKEIRVNEMRKVAEVHRKKRIETMIGKRVRVLTESDQKGYSDNFYRIKVPSDYEINKFYSVEIVGEKNNLLIGAF